VAALIERVLRKQRLERADHLTVTAGRQLCVDRQLDRTKVKLLESADLRTREGL
jgi:hypothetical protein